MNEFIWLLVTPILSASCGWVIDCCLQYVLMRTRMSLQRRIS